MALPWDKPGLLERLYWNEGMSLAEIADRWPEATRDSIRWQFKKHDIPRRDRGEGRRLKNAADVTVSVQNGRYRVEFREFGEHRQIPLARVVALLDHDLADLAGRHVHHENGCKLDDRPENLTVLDASDHHRRHAPDDGPPVYSAERRRAIAKNRDRDEKGRFT